MPEACRVHPDLPSTGTCEDCLSPLCPACTHVALDRTWCASCLSSRVGKPRVAGTRLKRPWFAFALTVLPGLGQVYNGFVARGIAEFGLFWLLMMVAQRDLPGFLLSLAAPVALLVAWIWCGLDALRTAREINARGYLPTRDESRSITRGPVTDEDLRFAGIGLVVIGALLFAQEAGGFILSVFRFAGPVGLIALGAWILHRKREKEARERNAREPHDGSRGFPSEGAAT